MVQKVEHLWMVMALALENVENVAHVLLKLLQFCHRSICQFSAICCGEDRSVLATRLHGRGFQAVDNSTESFGELVWIFLEHGFFQQSLCLVEIFIWWSTWPQVVEPFKCAGHASIFRVRDEPKRSIIEHEKKIIQFYINCPFERCWGENEECDTEPYVAKADLEGFNSMICWWIWIFRFHDSTNVLIQPGSMPQRFGCAWSMCGTTRGRMSRECG